MPNDPSMGPFRTINASRLAALLSRGRKELYGEAPIWDDMETFDEMCLAIGDALDLSDDEGWAIATGILDG